MDRSRFDDLTRRLTTATTRRAGLKAALGGLLGLAAQPETGGEAKKGKKKRYTPCPAVCPSGSACVDGVCTCTRPLCGGVCCASDRTGCENGRCVYTGMRTCDAVPIVDGADLSFCDFRDKTIKTRTLKNANFDGADLSGASLTNYFQPWGCSFRGAKLVGADLDECDIKPGTSFAGADLTDVTLRQAHVNGAVFSNATMRGADFKMTRIAATTFADADLRAAVLDGVVVTGCDFGGANLHRATIRNVTVADSAFVQADLSEAIFEQEMTFRRNDFSRASFGFADMVYAKSAFTDCIFDDANFYQVSTWGVAGAWKETNYKSFTSCRFHRARFFFFDDGGAGTYRVQLSRLRFMGSDLTGARFDRSQIHGVMFTDCILDGADLSSTGIGYEMLGEHQGVTTFTRTSMKGAKLDGMYRLREGGVGFDAEFIDADLDGASLGSAFPTDRISLLRIRLAGVDGWPAAPALGKYRCSSFQPDGSPIPDTHWHNSNYASIPCSQAPRPGS